MSKVKFIVETGKVDSNGDVIKLEGLKLPTGQIFITKDFDKSIPPIGTASVFMEDGVLKAEGEIPDEFIAGYPAVGIQIISSEPNENGGRNVTEAKLQSVSLCQQPNADPAIKRVSEQ